MFGASGADEPVGFRAFGANRALCLPSGEEVASRMDTFPPFFDRADLHVA